jgi:hypothetical protein
MNKNGTCASVSGRRVPHASELNKNGENGPKSIGAVVEKPGIFPRRKMSALDVLKNEYPGDGAWREFVAVFRPAWDAWKDKDPFRSALGDEEIATVLAVAMGVRALDWFAAPCGALGRRTPIEVLKTEDCGVHMIRTLLMRMPL